MLLYCSAALWTLPSRPGYAPSKSKPAFQTNSGEDEWGWVGMRARCLAEVSQVLASGPFCVETQCSAVCVPGFSPSSLTWNKMRPGSDSWVLHSSCSVLLRRGWVKFLTEHCKWDWWGSFIFQRGRPVGLCLRRLKCSWLFEFPWSFLNGASR